MSVLLGGTVSVPEVAVRGRRASRDGAEAGFRGAVVGFLGAGERECGLVGSVEEFEVREAVG